MISEHLQNILVLANDAGGAEMLSAMIRAERDNYQWQVVTPEQSPASVIFGKKGLEDIVRILKADQIISNQISWSDRDAIIYNPGWNDFPGTIIEQAELGSLKTVAILDHWTDYRRRFGYPEKNWRDRQPDYIVVCDEAAYKLAKDYGLSNILRMKNYYLIDQLAEFQRLTGKNDRTSDYLLFLSQTVNNPPVTDRPQSYIGAYEEEVLRQMADKFDLLSREFEVNKIRIRLHPSEARFRSFDVFRNFPPGILEIEKARDSDILENIAEARLVFGMNSMALFIAYLCGRPAVSIIPENSVVCELPLPPENLLRDLSEIFDEREDILSKPRFDLFPEHDFHNLIRRITET